MYVKVSVPSIETVVQTTAPYSLTINDTKQYYIFSKTRGLIDNFLKRGVHIN